MCFHPYSLLLGVHFVGEAASTKTRILFYFLKPNVFTELNTSMKTWLCPSCRTCQKIRLYAKHPPKIWLKMNARQDLHTLLGTNIAPENRPSQKEIHLPTIHFQVRTVSFREGNPTPSSSPHQKTSEFLFRIASVVPLPTCPCHRPPSGDWLRYPADRHPGLVRCEPPNISCGGQAFPKDLGIS